MKKGRTLGKLAEEIERQCKSKKDYISDTTALTMTDKGTLDLKDTGEFKIKNNAHGQLAARLKIPKQYYDRMLENSPKLLAENVNHWFQSNPEQRMIRTLDDEVRAFLSEKYRALDNWDLMMAALPILEEHEIDVNSSTFEVTENRLYLKAIFPHLETEIKGSPRVGDIVQAGLCISNSEVGAGSLRIEPFIYQLWCANGCFSNIAMRKYHTGRSNGTSFEDVQEILRDETKQISDKALWMQVGDVVRTAINQDIFQANVNKMAGTIENKIEGDSVKVVEVVQKTFNFNEGQRSDIMKHLIDGGDLSQYGLCNAVTRTANDQSDYEQATALERAGGKIIDLGPTEWNKLSQTK